MQPNFSPEDKSHGSLREHNQIRDDILKFHGAREFCRIWKQETGVAQREDRWIHYGVVGGGDISGIFRDGRRIEIEVKSGFAEQSSNQHRFQEMIEKHNGIYILARTVEDVTSRFLLELTK